MSRSPVDDEEVSVVASSVAGAALMESWPLYAFVVWDDGANPLLRDAEAKREVIWRSVIDSFMVDLLL